MAQYFTRRLLLWMPRKLWAVKLLCPTATCAGQELTSAGMHTVVRQVLDIDGWYNMASEYLACKTCKKKYISWSNEILKQLDIGHRVQFPAVLTYRYTFDLRVVRLLRMRGVGNSSNQLRRKLVEQHSEAWLYKTACYLTDCQTFHQASSRGLVSRPTFEKPVEMPKLPTAAWLLTVFCSDVWSRIEEVKASITSIFGRVLKLDSTKKVITFKIIFALFEKLESNCVCYFWQKTRKFSSLNCNIFSNIYIYICYIQAPRSKICI